MWLYIVSLIWVLKKKNKFIRRKVAATHMFKTMLLCAAYAVGRQGLSQGFIRKRCVGSLLKVYMCPKAKNGVCQKIFRLMKPCVSNLPFINHLWVLISVNQALIPPCTPPFLTVNSQCKAPHNCDPHINEHGMQLFLNGESWQQVRKEPYQWDRADSAWTKIKTSRQCYQSQSALFHKSHSHTSCKFFSHF